MQLDGLSPTSGAAPDATIEVLEAAIGEIEDEHDQADRPIVEVSGCPDADARAPIEEAEARMRRDFLPERRDEYIETIGGVVAYFAGRLPRCGEKISHANGIEFEITDADARRAKRIYMRVKPATSGSPADTKDVSVG